MPTSDQSSFSYNKEEIQNITKSIPNDARDNFPDHIFEPERIEIARELVLKEYYKLFPALTAKDFDRISDDILGWLSGNKYELAPVSDFWNYIDGMMLTLKLKNVIPEITSANISWKLESLNPKDIPLYAPIVKLETYSDPPYTYDFIHEHVLQNPTQKAINIQVSDEKSAHTLPRDHYPILTRRELDGTITLLDGNRRVLRGLLYNKLTIDAWVGNVIKEPLIQDHWVNTGLLRRLLDTYKHSQNPEGKIALESQLSDTLKSSSIARQNFKERCVPHYPFIAELNLPKF